MKTIVISAVNLNVGGTLTILRDCLGYLSTLARQGGYRVIAIVYQRELADFPNIEYIETQWPKKKWTNRLWFEYVSMNKISKEIGPVYLWLSLHDTTPNVMAEKRAVYCHNPFPFYKWKIRECLFAPKIVLFALFSKFIYQKNIALNDYVIVQQQWIKREFVRMFGLAKERIIVALPDFPKEEKEIATAKERGVYSFIYAASPNSHKNFECLCKAAEMMEAEGDIDFQVYITFKGNENSYAEWLFKRWGEKIKSLRFIGFQDRKSLFSYYAQSDCLVFPSKVETWGLPITEFASFAKPMLLADLPYAHETAAGADRVAFFNPDKPSELALYMRKLIKGQTDILHKVDQVPIDAPLVDNWGDLFEVLLNDRAAKQSSNIGL